MSPAIAIVGIGCRYPDARSPLELWENVLAQRRAFRRIPAERMRLDDYLSADRTAPDSLYSGEAAVIEGWEFDRVRYRIAGSSYRAADLAHWLALDVATQALGDAGFADGAGLPRETAGVLVGNTLTGEFSRAQVLRLRWPYVRRVIESGLKHEGIAPDQRRALIESLEATYKQPFQEVGEETLAGGLSNTIAGRICNHYDLKGGGYTVDGACAASLLAVTTACQSLESGDLDIALAGGVDLSLDPFELVGFAKAGALAADEMRVYDLRSQGFWPGEGCGFVVLMRHADALAQGRRIHAVIRGWGISSDGSGGITRPEVEGQILALRRAYRRAGYGADTVGYFEGHGTGTAVGDATELEVLSLARTEAGATAPAALGTIKANIGHTKAAAGIAGLIKATLAVRHRVLPPTTGCEQPHARLTVAEPALRVLGRAEPWPADQPVRASVSAMGFGGINTHITLEGADPAGTGVAPARAGDAHQGTGATRERAGAVHEHAGTAHERVGAAPETSASSERTGVPARPAEAFASAAGDAFDAWQDAELFLFGAADSTALAAAVRRIHGYAARLSRAELADLAAALQRALPAGGARAAIVAGRPAELAERAGLLLEWLASGVTRRLDPERGVFLGAGDHAPRIALLFSGQAAPVRLDGGALARRFAATRDLYARAALPRSADTVATAVAQPAIVTASIAALELLERMGVVAAAAVGHSLGEITALRWAGAFDTETAIRIAFARGKAMMETPGPPSGMIGIGAAAADVAPLLVGTPAVIAGLNLPDQTVISGEVAAIEAVATRARARGWGAVRLPVSHAFHSPLMCAAAAPLAAHLARETIHAPQRTVVSTITGAALDPAEDLRRLLIHQLTMPVRFMDAIAGLGEVDLAIEVGPGGILAGMARRLLAAPVIAVDAAGASLRGLLEALGAAFAAGAPLDHAALFAGRFTRPFELDWSPRFFANPCEQAPLPDDESESDLDPAASATGDGRSAGSNGGNEASGGTSRKPPGRAAVARAERAGSATATAVAAEPTPGKREDPLDVVRALVAERAELPLAAVTAESRLLDDLHLNSISVAQLAAAAARRLGLKPSIAPTDFAHATVAQIAAALAERLRAGDDGAPEPESAPAGVDAWVRTFTVELVERPARHRTTPGGSGSWRVFAPPAHPLQAPLETALARAPGRGVVMCLPAEPDDRHVAILLEAARTALAAGAGTFVMVQHGGGAAGFARTLHLEAPEIATRVIDVPFDHPRAAEWIAAESGGAEGYAEVHYDAAGTRREPVLRALALPEATGALPIGSDDVLLVTGGGKGIAAECALALARETGCRLALMGRSDPARDTELAANLERLREAGIAFRYVAGDVSDAEAVRGGLEGVEAALGPVTAILCGAGINEPQLLRDLDESAFLRTMAAKVQGAINVLGSVDLRRLKLFVAFGSIIARTGMRGEADYALANEWLTRLTDQLQRQCPDARCLSIEWSVWSGVGMGERLGRIDTLMQMGITPIVPDEGIAILRRLLSAPLARTSVVVTGRFGELPTLQIEEAELPLLRFLERPLVHFPGIELVTEAELSLESDPYLEDHAFEGERLFPAVMGLEAMAQVAMALAGSAQSPRFEDVRFERPIALGEGGAPVTVRIAALARAADRVDVVVRCSGTGFQVDHFRATCRFDAVRGADGTGTGAMHADGPDLAAEGNGRVPLDPERDLYGGILFHRGRFRRLAGYRALRATACTAEIAAGDGADWFGRYLPQRLVLGDVAARDTAIHAIQACIPHATILPIGVERLSIAAQATDGTRVVRARERSRDGNTLVYDLEVAGESGTVLERWEGLTLRIVAEAPAPAAWPAALVGPCVERRIGELVPGLVAAVILARDQTGERRERGDAAMRRALGGGSIQRRSDGKPVTSGGNQSVSGDPGPDGAEARAVSAAHAGPYTLAVAGRGPLGCDLEPIAPRAEAVWQDLLGAERAALAGRIASESGEEYDAAATRVWAALECLKKAGAPVGAPLTLGAATAPGWIVLASGSLSVASVVITLEGIAEPLVLAILGPTRTHSCAPTNTATSSASKKPTSSGTSTTSTT